MPRLPHVYQDLLEPAYRVKGDMGSVRELAGLWRPPVSEWGAQECCEAPASPGD